MRGGASIQLSDSFSIDPAAGWVRAHNQEAQEVLSAFERDRPLRVPLINPDAVWQHGFYMEETGVDFGRYYSEPEEMVRVQLEAARRRRELPIYDFVLGQLPVSWPVVVEQHPVTPYGWVGCELLYTSNYVPAHKSLNLSREECADLEIPDPDRGGILEVIHRMLDNVSTGWATEGTFLGRPIDPIYAFVDSYGLFDLAMAIRGIDLMSDFYEDPEFAASFLQKVADWEDILANTWARGSRIERPHFPMSDHGIDMLSPEIYERFLVPVIKEMNRRRGAAPGTRIHHCGRGVHLFPIMKKHFGLTSIEGLAFPGVDIAAVRRDVGEEVWITAMIADEIVMQGPAEAIRQSVKDLMASGAKGEGRFALEIGDMLPGTPLEHRIALYEAVKEFGRYPSGIC